MIMLVEVRNLLRKNLGVETNCERPTLRTICYSLDHSNQETKRIY